MEQKKIRDPKSLKTLMTSLLSAEAAEGTDPKSRWKVGNKVRKLCGKEYVETDRLAMLPTVLEFFYGKEVEHRHMQYTHGSYDTGKIVGFLTDKEEKPSLLLYGSTGTGKTTLLTAMFKTIRYLYRDELSRHEMAMLWVKSSDLPTISKKDSERFTALKRADLLFIDDLGFFGEEKSNDYGVMRFPVEELIEYRYDKQYATLCSSNLSHDQLKEHYGERIYSRMREMFRWEPMIGRDHRIESNKPTVNK